MAVKYVSIPEQKKTIAILSNTKYSAVNKIAKLVNGTGICFDTDKYLMKNTYRSVVCCAPGEEFDAEMGKELAREKLLEHYRRDLGKKLEKFARDTYTVYLRYVSA